MLNGKGGETRISRIITNGEGSGGRHSSCAFCAFSRPLLTLAIGSRFSDFSPRPRSRRQVKKPEGGGCRSKAHSLSPLMFEPVSRLSPVHPARRPGASLVLLALSLACAPSPNLPGHWQESGRLIALTNTFNLAGARKSVCQGNPYLLCRGFPYKKSAFGLDRDRRRPVLQDFRAIS